MGPAAPTAQPRSSAPYPGYQPPPPVGAPPPPYGYQQQQQQQAPPPVEEDYRPPDPGDPNGHLRNVWKWQGNPRGGAGETARTGNCPSCGSPRYFSLQTPETGKMDREGRMVYPSPECSDCGYPKQQGALAASTVSGQAPARQAEAPPPPGSLGALRGR